MNPRSPRFARRSHPYTDKQFPLARIGNIFDDAVDLVRKVPGGDWIVNAAANGADWIGTAAKTPEGLFALQVITSGTATALSQVAIPSVSGMQTVGPVLASVVFALPGSVAGKPFLQSYVEELTTRIVQTAAVLAANPALAASVGTSLGVTLSPATGAAFSKLDALQKVQKAFSEQLLKLLQNPTFQSAMRNVNQTLGTGPDRAKVRKTLRATNTTAPQLASQYGVRPDVAAAAVNGSLALPKGVGYGIGAPEVGSSEFDIYGRPNQTYDNTEVNTGGNPGGVLDPTRGQPLPDNRPRPTGGSPDEPGSPTGLPGLMVRASSPKPVWTQLVTVAVLTAPGWAPFVYRRWKEHS